MCGWRNWHVCPLRATAWCEHREMNRVRTGVDNMVCMHVRVSVCLSCRAVTCVELRASCRPSERFSRFYLFCAPWQRPPSASSEQRGAWHCVCDLCRQARCRWGRARGARSRPGSASAGGAGAEGLHLEHLGYTYSLAFKGKANTDLFVTVTVTSVGWGCLVALVLRF